jgi:hypothetical protein
LTLIFLRALGSALITLKLFQNHQPALEHRQQPEQDQQDNFLAFDYRAALMGTHRMVTRAKRFPAIRIQPSTQTAKKIPPHYTRIGHGEATLPDDASVCAV